MTNPALKLLDRVNGCEHCILDENGNHQFHCKIETDRRAHEIQERLNAPNPISITLEVEAMQEAA